MPQHLEIPDSGGSSIKRKRKGRHVSISENTHFVDGMDGELCSELPAIETAVGGEQAGLAVLRNPAVGRRQQKRTRKVANAMRRLASRFLPWRSLPYLRVKALDDICTNAETFGNDFPGISPPADWLDVGEARRFLNNVSDK